jgi:hypothetical protein
VSKKSDRSAKNPANGGKLHAAKGARQVLGVSDQLGNSGLEEGCDDALTSARVSRTRFGKLPKPLPGRLPYAKSNPLLKDFDEAKITASLLASDAWKDVMGDPANPQDGKPLNRLDAERTKPGKQAPLYSAHELESVLVYQRVCGLRSYKEARDRLTSDRGAPARELLGFNRPRNVRFRKVMTLRDGVPSEATVSRHRLRFAPDQDYATLAEKQQAAFKARARTWKRLERRLLKEHVKDEDLREEARLLHLDGSAIITHYTPPDVTGDSEDVNWNMKAGRRVTAPDAGYKSKEAGITRVGPGWNLVTVTTQSGVPMAWKLTAINTPEIFTAQDLAQRELKWAMGQLDRESEEIRVLVADAGFTGSTLRRSLREIGLLENIHHVSHSKAEGSQANAKEKDEYVFGIEKSPGILHENWYANGHRELKCKCGQGVVAKRVSRGKNGRTIVKVEGQCDTCKPISIVSGNYYVVRDPASDDPLRQNRLTPTEKTTPSKDVDFLFGNPLTFNDAVSAEYGRGRWSYNEGFYGQLVSRFQLLKGKRWIRFADQARLEASMTFAVMHAVTLEERARRRGSTWAAEQAQARGQAPPGLAAAA